MRIQAADREVHVSKPDKILFPDIQASKADVAGYYARAAEFMLPHLQNRALTLHRFPDGINGQGFYQHALPDAAPDFAEGVTLPMVQGGEKRHTRCRNAACLVWLADQGTIALHGWCSPAATPDKPDRLLFDLDPSHRDVETLLLAARLLRDILEDLGFMSFAMATGSRGLHVLAPLRGGQEFDSVRDFARGVAALAASEAPERLTTEHRKDKRRGRLFLDTTRNAYGQTAIMPYSLRALPGAPVATPLDWHELSPDFDPRGHDMGSIFRRLGQKGDCMRDFASHGAPLADADRRLARRLKNTGLEP